jgi:hypothetical protein
MFENDDHEPWVIWNRVLAALVAGTALLGFYFLAGERAAWGMYFWVFLPMALLWFPEEMADSLHLTSFPKLVAALGWAVLFIVLGSLYYRLVVWVTA